MVGLWILGWTRQSFMQLELLLQTHKKKQKNNKKKLACGSFASWNLQHLLSVIYEAIKQLWAENVAHPYLDLHWGRGGGM